jgi:perosamine synthetase
MNDSLNVEEILQTLRAHLPDQGNYSLHEPKFSGREWEYVKTCIDTGWVSSVGHFVDRFEKDLSEYTGAKYAIVTTNGTSALHMSLMLAGVQTGDEVLVPALTFIATCNVIHYCNAIPHFVEIDKTNLGVDAKKLEAYLKENTFIINKVCYNKKTERPIRALCVMHTFGHPVDLDALNEIAKHYCLALVEDAAEALGSYYKDKHVGAHGLVGALSFNGNKIMTTGGGGALLTNDEEIAKRAKHLTTTAKKSHPWLYEHDQVGYNYRLPNINAALGCAQLEQMDYFLKTKRMLAEQYEAAFSKVEGVSFVLEPQYAKSNYWLNAILLDEKYQSERDGLLEFLNQEKIGARPVWELMHTLPMYQQSPRMNLSVAESLAARLINIPSSVVLGEQYAKC